MSNYLEITNARELIRDYAGRDDDEDVLGDSSYDHYRMGLCAMYDDMPADLRAAFELIDANLEHEYVRHWLSIECVGQSVCPVHRCDYVACFLDDDPECAQVRMYFPQHDT